MSKQNKTLLAFEPSLELCSAHKLVPRFIGITNANLLICNEYKKYITADFVCCDGRKSNSIIALRSFN